MESEHLDGSKTPQVTLVLAWELLAQVSSRSEALEDSELIYGLCKR